MSAITITLVELNASSRTPDIGVRLEGATNKIWLVLCHFEFVDSFSPACTHACTFSQTTVTVEGHGYPSPCPVLLKTHTNY